MPRHRTSTFSSSTAATGAPLAQFPVLMREGDDVAVTLDMDEHSHNVTTLIGPPTIAATLNHMKLVENADRGHGKR